MERAWFRESNTSRCALGSTTHFLWAWALLSASLPMESGGIAGAGPWCWLRIQRDAREQYKKARGKFWKIIVKLAEKKKRMHTTECALLCEHGERELCCEDPKFDTAFPASATDFPHKIRQPSDPVLQNKGDKNHSPSFGFSPWNYWSTVTHTMVLTWLLGS